MSSFLIKSLQELNAGDSDKWKNMQLIDKNLDSLRATIRNETDPSHAIDKDKVSSLILGLIDIASFRIGSAEAQSFGASTVKTEHLRFKDGNAIFDYIGKKGVRQVKVISDPYYVNLLKQMVKYSENNGCEQLFCYQLPSGEVKGITDNDVRNKLNEEVGTRNVHAFRARKANEIIINSVLRDREQGYREALQDVVSELGHFRTNKIGQMVLERRGSTAEKSYIHPDLHPLKFRTGGFSQYGEVSKSEGKVLSRKQIIKSIRNGNLKEDSRQLFFNE